MTRAISSAARAGRSRLDGARVHAGPIAAPGEAGVPRTRMHAHGAAATACSSAATMNAAEVAPGS